MRWLLMVLVFQWFSLAQGKEIALSFDDAPMSSSAYFESHVRTESLIKSLRSMNVPPVMVFANGCKRDDSFSVLKQLRTYKAAGHLIGNHTCNHPRLDDVGHVQFSKDAEKNDALLSSLFVGQKYFRFPYLNEGNQSENRDQMRRWLKAHRYRNGLVSVDNSDYVFTDKLKEAQKKGHTIDSKKVEAIFVKHLVGAVKFYDELAVRTIGYSPKHVLLLHEMDATVLFMEALVKALRDDGWKIIGIEDAYKDPLYLSQPKSLFASNGILAQLHEEKTGERLGYLFSFDELDTALGL